MMHPLGSLEAQSLRLKEALQWPELNNVSLKDLILPAEALYIDAVDLKKIDSIGMAYLIYLVQKAKKNNINIHWQNIPDCLKQLMQLYEIELWMI